MLQRHGATILVIVLLVLAATPMMAEAQSVPRNVLLDQETERIATVTLDDQTYQVYRIENLVWFASGIDIYTDGERVRSSTTARAVLERLARQRAVEELGPADVRGLQQTKRNVSRAITPAERTASAVNTSFAHIRTLQASEVDGSTAYNASVEAAPRLADYNDTARDVAPRLDAFVTTGEAFTENASQLLELIERQSAGESVDSLRLYRTYLRTVQTADRLSSPLGYTGGIVAIDDVHADARHIATNVSTVDETGNRTAAIFDRVANTTGQTANLTAAIEPPGGDFDRVEERADTLEGQWMNRWQSRQNAGTDVYYSLAGLVVGLAALVGVRWWTA